MACNRENIFNGKIGEYMHKQNISLGLILCSLYMAHACGMQSSLDALQNALHKLRDSLQGQRAPTPVTSTDQRIAILAFGSLVENPGNLDLIESNGFKSNGQQGPAMRIDYARTSKDGRLTLVIAPGMDAHELKTYYATYNGNDVHEAIEALRAREGTSKKNIGYVDLTTKTYSRRNFDSITGIASEPMTGQINDRDPYYNSNPMLQRVVKWAQDPAHDYTAVIWTDLPPTFTKAQFTLDTLKGHLASLDVNALLKAYCYFKMTPVDIRNGTRFGNDLMNHAAGFLRARIPEVAEILRTNGIRNNFENLTIADCIKIIWG